MMKLNHRVTLSFRTIGVLVAIACVASLALLGSMVLQKGYQGGSGPEAVAYNYLMALIRRDYVRAHSYLSPALPQYPATVESFIGDLEEHSLLPDHELQPCVYMESVETTDNRAAVVLRVQYYDPCMRGGPEIQNLSFNRARLDLERARNEWQIVGSEGGFFYLGWAHSIE